MNDEDFKVGSLYTVIDVSSGNVIAKEMTAKKCAEIMGITTKYFYRLRVVERNKDENIWHKYLIKKQTYSHPNAKAIVVVDPKSGKIVKKYKCLNDASSDKGYCYEQMRRICRGENKKNPHIGYDGFWYGYLEDFNGK